MFVGTRRRLISAANCKNASPLSPLIREGGKGRKKGWIGAESGGSRFNYSRPIFRPFDAARRIDTHRSSMRPNLASWRINWQTRRARSVLSLSLFLYLDGEGEFWTSYRGLVTLFPSFSSRLTSWESCCTFRRILGRVRGEWMVIHGARLLRGYNCNFVIFSLELWKVLLYHRAIGLDGKLDDLTNNLRIRLKFWTSGQSLEAQNLFLFISIRLVPEMWSCKEEGDFFNRLLSSI